MGFYIPVDGEVQCDACGKADVIQMNLAAGIGTAVGAPGEKDVSLPNGWEVWTNRWYKKQVLCPSCYVDRDAAN